MTALLACSLSQAQETTQETIDFDVIFTEVDDEPIGNGIPKTPKRPPVVYIEDNTLTFAADHPEYVLFIRDEEGDVVYTTVVSSSVTQVVLPSTLSGEYQIELTMGSWLFTGWIFLE